MAIGTKGWGAPAGGSPGGFFAPGSVRPGAGTLVAAARRGPAPEPGATGAARAA